MSIYNNRAALAKCLVDIDVQAYTGDMDLGGLDDLLGALKLLIISATIEAVTAQACGSEKKHNMVSRIKK